MRLRRLGLRLRLRLRLLHKHCTVRTPEHDGLTRQEKGLLLRWSGKVLALRVHHDRHGHPRRRHLRRWRHLTRLLLLRLLWRAGAHAMRCAIGVLRKALLLLLLRRRLWGLRLWHPRLLLRRRLYRVHRRRRRRQLLLLRRLLMRQHRRTRWHLHPGRELLRRRARHRAEEAAHRCGRVLRQHRWRLQGGHKLWWGGLRLQLRLHLRLRLRLRRLRLRRWRLLLLRLLLWGLLLWLLERLRGRVRGRPLACLLHQHVLQVRRRKHLRRRRVGRRRGGVRRWQRGCSRHSLAALQQLLQLSRRPRTRRGRRVGAGGRARRSRTGLLSAEAQHAGLDAHGSNQIAWSTGRCRRRRSGRWRRGEGQWHRPARVRRVGGFAGSRRRRRFGWRR